MAMIEFTHYLHESLEGYEFSEWIASQTGLTTEQVEEMDLGEPFYEIGIRCVLDTEQGEIIIMGIDKGSL